MLVSLPALSPQLELGHVTESERHLIDINELVGADDVTPQSNQLHARSEVAPALPPHAAPQSAKRARHSTKQSTAFRPLGMQRTRLFQPVRTQQPQRFQQHKAEAGEPLTVGCSIHIGGDGFQQLRPPLPKQSPESRQYCQPGGPRKRGQPLVQTHRDSITASQQTVVPGSSAQTDDDIMSLFNEAAFGDVQEDLPNSWQVRL